MAGKLAGKSIIVAGGATGIGAETARRLAAEGARVVIGDINAAQASAVAAEIAASGGQAIFCPCDIASDDSVKSLVAAAVQTYGGLDGIHVNAADLAVIQQDYDALEISLETFDRTIAVDLRGYLLCTRHALPEILKRGGGALVYTSSGAAFVGEPVRVAYAAAKAGVNALMRHVASRWGKQGIRANAVSPGLVLSETARTNLSQDILDGLLAANRAPRLGQPRDIAAMVVFLMTQDGEWINGQTINIDGGHVLT